MMNLRYWPVTYWLLIILFAVFVVQIVALNADVPFTELLVVNPGAVLNGQQLWGLFTNMFLHGSIWHIIINSWVLFMFGLGLERVIGRREFLKVFLVSGFFASVFYVLTSVFILNSYSSALGASGAIFGILGAMIALRPNQKVIILFPPIPKPIPLWVLGIFLVAISLLWFGFGGDTGVAENAHLGGMIIGFLLGRRYRGLEQRKHGAVYSFYQPKDNYDWIDDYR